MRQFIKSWGMVCALALGGLACVESPEAASTVEPAEAPAQARAEMLPVYVEHPEPIRYAYRPVLYVNNFTQPQPLPTEATLRAPGGPVEKIRDLIYAHMQHINRATKGLLQPSFDGVVTINWTRQLPESKFGRKPNGDLYLDGGEAGAMLASEFGGALPGPAFLLWNGGANTGRNLPQATYGDAFIVMTVGQTYLGTSYENYYDLTHETLHMFDFRLERGTEGIQNPYTAMVHADTLSPSPSPCITTSAAYDASGNLHWSGDVLPQNILSLNQSCTTQVPQKYINWCEFSAGGARFGTFNSDLCSEGALLNPLVDHSWVRNASMADANWLYTEWDVAQGANNYVLKVEVLNGAGSVVATVQKTETGGTDRGSFRYRYFHRGDICPALQAANVPGGTYRMRFRVSPSMADPNQNKLYAHKKDVTGTITCGYGLDTATWTLGGHGGSGGTSYTYTCPSGYVAVGLTGRYGTYVNALGLICAPLNSDGSLGGTYNLGYYGGSGGTYFADVCPSGQMLVGLAGNSYAWTDRIAGDCANVKTWLTSGYIDTYMFGRGGTGGAAYSEVCPRGYTVTSMYLRAGQYVDYIQGKCTRVKLQ